ncbi:hypothetical protein ACLKA7_014878 [Drosophila subpalustris]
MWEVLQQQQQQQPRNDNNRNVEDHQCSVRCRTVGQCRPTGQQTLIRGSLWVSFGQGQQRIVIVSVLIFIARPQQQQHQQQQQQQQTT